MDPYGKIVNLRGAGKFNSHKWPPMSPSCVSKRTSFHQTSQALLQLSDLRSLAPVRKAVQSTEPAHLSGWAKYGNRGIIKIS